MPQYFYLSVQSTDVGFEMGLNDVPVISDPQGRGVITDEPMNRWIRPEKNRFTLYLFWPPGKNYEPGLAEFKAKLFIADPNADVPQPAEELATFEWPPPEEDYPHQYEEEIEIDDPPPQSLWSEAESVEELSERDEREILALVHKLHSHLTAGEAQGALEMLDYRYTEEARSEGKDPARIREVALQQYKWLMDRGALEGQMLQPEEAAFVLAADGQIVCVRRNDGRPPIVLDQPEKNTRFSVEVYAARISDEWLIVR